MGDSITKINLSGEKSLDFRAIRDYAQKCHEGQLYGDETINDYYRAHIVKVVDSVMDSGGDDIAIAVAYLHDVVEDCEGVTLEDIRNLFGDEVANGVDAITKRDGESRDDYLERCCDNTIARFVKVHDAWCNLSASTRQGDIRRIRKYEGTLNKLLF